MFRFGLFVLSNFFVCRLSNTQVPQSPRQWRSGSFDSSMGSYSTSEENVNEACLGAGGPTSGWGSPASVLNAASSMNSSSGATPTHAGVAAVRAAGMGGASATQSSHHTAYGRLMGE